MSGIHQSFDDFTMVHRRRAARAGIYKHPAYYRPRLTCMLLVVQLPPEAYIQLPIHRPRQPAVPCVLYSSPYESSRLCPLRRPLAPKRPTSEASCRRPGRYDWRRLPDQISRAVITVQPGRGKIFPP
eukprot:scaffold613285_cov32-Prasinocladus_malaysianus.AAC.2